MCILLGCTLSPPSEYDEMICVAAAITVAALLLSCIAKFAKHEMRLVVKNVACQGGLCVPACWPRMWAH